MSRVIILMTIFLFAGYWAFGQATPVERYRIANNTTAMGVNMPTGTQVFDVAGQKLYIALKAVPATITIKTGLADSNPYFKEFASISIPVYAPDGTEVVELVSSSGRIWMDRNLGATQAATSETDYLAYGSIFQWCRAADGHEKITWTSSTAGTPVNGTTSTLSTSTDPGHSLFIICPDSPYDWLSSHQMTGGLWWNGSLAGSNSPCPTGYHVPTKAEWQAEISVGINNTTTAYSQLKLTRGAARRNNDALIYMPDSHAYYWSSTDYGGDALCFFCYSEGALIQGLHRANGLRVRCIKNQ